MRTLSTHVEGLQRAVHGGEAEDWRRGRFRFLGRTIDFGGAERIDWRRSLGEDSSPLWRLTLAYFGWAVPILAAGDAAGRQAITVNLRQIEDLRVWSGSGAFRDVWNPYTASHRLLNLLAGLALAPPMRPDDPDVRMIVEHARLCAVFIRLDLERDLQFNHLLKNLVALAAYCAAVDEIPKSLHFLRAAVPQSLDQIVLPDGGHAERSPMYHALGLLDLRILRDASIFTADWQPALTRKLDAMESALGVLSHPDGDVALFNDSWIGGAPRVDALSVPRPAPGRHDLPHMGFTRLDGGSDCAILDCGSVGPPENPAHAHAGLLSLELSVAGQRLLVDAGTPTYVTGELRDLSRSAAQHNGPHLAGLEPIEYWKSFRVGRRAAAGRLSGPGLDAAPLWVAAWHDGYRQRGVEVRRWLGLWPGCGAVIIDLWQGQDSDRSNDAAASHFLIGPQWPLASTQPVRLNGPRTVVVQALHGALSDPTSAPYWPRYGEEQTTLRLAMRPAGDCAGLRFQWADEPVPSLPETIEAVIAALRRAQPIDKTQPMP